MVLRRIALLIAIVLPVVLLFSNGLNTTDIANASVAPCSIDGTGCRVGSVGPGGGIVFYDAGSMQWWGRFLEAKTTSVPAAGPWGSAVGNPRVANKEIGMGRCPSAGVHVPNVQRETERRMREEARYRPLTGKCPRGRPPPRPCPR